MIESGKRTPSYENLLKISEAIGCSVEEISNKHTVEYLSSTIKDHIQGMSEVELEKVIDYIETIKRGRR
jgi:transcriptional regulator with XRE-family HTH domain